MLKFSTEEWDAEPEDIHTSGAEQPPLQVIRKGNNPSETNCLFYLFLEYFCVIEVLHLDTFLTLFLFLFLFCLSFQRMIFFFSDIVSYLFENVYSFLINSLTKYFPQVYFIYFIFFTINEVTLLILFNLIQVKAKKIHI